MSATTTKRRKTRRAVCVPIYLAVVTDRKGTSCPFSHVEREHVEAFCESFNSTTGPGSRAVVKVSRYLLPVAKGGAR